MRSGFGRIDDDIQRNVRRIRREQGEEAAREYELRAYQMATSGLKPLLGGAAAGAAIGSIIPVVGTVAGFVVGLFAGAAIDIYNSSASNEDES